jgi:hypothetical protein
VRGEVARSIAWEGEPFMATDNVKDPADPLAGQAMKAAVRKNAGTPYFRQVHATLLEGQLTVDQSCITAIEKTTSNAMSFWVGGGSLYMH